METTRDIMRNSPEFKDNLSTLIEKRLFSELPNSYYPLLEILVKDPSNKALEEKIKSIIKEKTVYGRVVVEKFLEEGKEDIYKNYFNIHIYDQSDEVENISVSSIEEELVTDYKISQETSNNLLSIAVDYEFKKAEIASDLEGKTY